MWTNNIKLEVCVDSIASALAAVEGGASRIELCAALGEGGLTPSVGTLKALKDLPINIPIYCMLRPRRGNEFVYSQLEMEAVRADMTLLRLHGADGFVFGALTPQRNIDLEICQHVVQHAAGVPVTFHRAFDLTNPIYMHGNIARIKELGFQRLLSSGFKQTAVEGMENLAEMIARYHRDLVIMPGAGITVANLEEILLGTKCTEFHASAKVVGEVGEVTRMDCDVTMGKQDVLPYTITDVHVVRKMVSIARAILCK